jgi:hypothetical protein
MSLIRWLCPGKKHSATCGKKRYFDVKAEKATFVITPVRA